MAESHISELRSKEASTCVFFVRHGQTDFPHNRIYCDDVEDPPLNSEGVAQANRAAAFFKNKSIAAIYSSPAARTMSTAKAIADICGCSVIADGSLRERRYGDWEGMEITEIEKKFPDAYLAWKKDQVQYTPTGGETLDQLVARVAGLTAEIVRRHTNSLVVIVSHVGPIRASICHAFGVPWEQFRQLNVDNASITQINYGKKKNNLVFLNCTNR